MLATSTLMEDNSNSPNLFCYKQPLQTTESKDFKSELSSQDTKKSSKNSLNSNGNNLEDESSPGS